MKRFLIHFFAALLLTNAAVFGVVMAGAHSSYWTYILTVAFSLVYATVMVLEPRIKL